MVVIAGVNHAISMLYTTLGSSECYRTFRIQHTSVPNTIRETPSACEDTLVIGSITPTHDGNRLKYKLLVSGYFGIIIIIIMYEFCGSEVSWLRIVRFPFGMLGT